jgi:hypothetical protein
VINFHQLKKGGLKMFYRKVDSDDDTNLGRAVRSRAELIVRQRYLNGEFGVDQQAALERASKIVAASIAKQVRRIQEGRSGKGKNSK